MAEVFETYFVQAEEYVYLSYDKIIKITENAVCFDLGDAFQWVPIRHIDLDKFEWEPEHEKLVPVKTWFATNNGLI